MRCITKGANRCTEGCNCTGVGSQIVRQIPKDELSIVHFPHNGTEYPVLTYRRDSANAIKISEGNYDVYWNCRKKHYRRLVKVSDCAYIDDEWNYHEGEELCVWTEWESITRASKMPQSSNPLGATFIHQPKYPVSVAISAKEPNKYYGNGKASDALNTDPCIFGRTFKYAICRQGHDPWLRKLAENSLVLFWSHKSDSFCLDTVFVVGKNPVDYIIGSSSKIRCSQEYRNLTLDRLDNGVTGTFYRGISYDKNNPPPIYSFAPAARLCDKNSACRCEFKVEDIKQLNMAIGGSGAFIKSDGHFRSKHECVSSGRIKCVWDKLVELVMGKGFSLGVHFDWPKVETDKV